MNRDRSSRAGLRSVSRFPAPTQRPAQRRLRLEALEDRCLLAAHALATLVDDVYEQNDTRATATNLGALTATKTINNLVQADANDWYKFTIGSAATTGSSVTIGFEHAKGDLDLELYNSAGNRVRVSQSIANSETISIAGFPAGTYYVRVYGYRGVTNPNYSLGINLSKSAPVSAPDDAYENNDTQALAANLGTLTTNANLSNLALTDSADWFRFTTTATGTSANTVAINFQNAQGNLALQLYNSSGMMLDASNGVGNSESVSLAGRAAGTYYARIYGASGATNPNYSFQIIAPTPPTTTTTPTGGHFDIQINYAGFTASQRAIFEQAAARWESVIVGDLPSAIYNGVVVDDLLINATSTAIDGVGGTLGQAGYDRARTSGTQLPYHGSMEFDSADLAAMERDGSLLSVIEHEIGHVLGIGTLWQAKGLLTGAGGSNPQFTGRQAVAAYNAIFGTSETGVPVENSGGGGTRDSHWRESTFNNEIMTGYINSGANPLSRITVASLADLGYTVNMAVADTYTPPASSSNLVAGRSSSSGSASVVLAPNNSVPNVASSAITGGESRSDRDAHNITPRNSPAAAVLAMVDHWIQAWRTNEPETALTVESPASRWSEIVDLLFAGENELDCGVADAAIA